MRKCRTRFQGSKWGRALGSACALVGRTRRVGGVKVKKLVARRDRRVAKQAVSEA